MINAIAEHVEGATTVNAGLEPFGAADPAIRAIDDLQREARPPWGGIRHDAFTFRLAMHHLATARPRVLYIAFDETDDWAHDGRYDLRARRLRADRRLPAAAVDVGPEPARNTQGRTHLLDHDRSRARAGRR